jgi:hypothetical protein
MLNSVMLSVTLDDCHYPECHYDGCHYPNCNYDDCHYAECHYAECCYDVCPYAELLWYYSNCMGNYVIQNIFSGMGALL